MYSTVARGDGAEVVDGAETIWRPESREADGGADGLQRPQRAQRVVAGKSPLAATMGAFARGEKVFEAPGQT